MRDILDMDQLVWILSCRIGSLPLVYLGLPLGACNKFKLVWEPIIEKIGFRLEA